MCLTKDLKAALAALFLLLPACQQEMAHQPSYRPLTPSRFFGDDLSARPLVPGTVARGVLLPGHPVDTGEKPIEAADWARAAGIVGSLSKPTLGAVYTLGQWSPYVDAFPFPVTRALLERGQERFNIYCAVCHDRLGTGKGMIVQRGFTPPPSYHTDLSRGYKLRGIELKLTDAPVGYYYEVITRGFGAMPDYAAQVPPHDRWAIIAYIRALQFSQHAALADVGAAARSDLLGKAGGQR